MFLPILPLTGTLSLRINDILIGKKKYVSMTSVIYIGAGSAK